MKTIPARLEGKAFSYIRFSSREQEKGDSVRRQKELRDKWLSDNPGVELDERTLEDLGVPALRGLNRHDDRFALAQFLKWLDDKVVLPGSFFIVESLDRITREEIGEGTELLLSIINRGVRVVVLMPAVHIFAKPVQLTDLIVAIVELSRANSESATKAKRVSEKWTERKRAAGESGAIVTARCPKWLRVAGGRFEFRAGARGLIRRMFQMSRAGHGARGIAAALNREKVTAWGKGKWEEAYVRKILSGREALGEYQPCRVTIGERKKKTDGKSPRVKVRVPDGDPIPNYYPAAVSEQDWYAVAAARKARDNGGGRPPKDAEHVNIFAGLLNDATTRGKLQSLNRVDDHRRLYRVLVPAAYRRHGERCASFPTEQFERALLSKLAEIDPREILPEDRTGDRVLEVSGRKAKLEQRLAAAKAQLIDGDQDVGAVMAGIRELEAKRKKAEEELATLQQRAASPQAEAWGECKGLVGALASAPDKREARVRLRAVIRRVVSEVWSVFVPVGAWRVAAVQLWFVGGRHRDYMILHRPTRPTHGKMLPAVLRVESFAAAGIAGKMDLRNPEHAAVVEEVLAGLDVSVLKPE